MTHVLNVTRQRGSARPVWSALLVAFLASVQLSAQDQRPAAPSDESASERAAASPASVVSLERVRFGLATTRSLTLPDGKELDFWDSGPSVDRRRSVQLFRGFDLVGVDPFGGTMQPAPIGAPTHREMMQMMTPRWFTEGRPTDWLGAATASTFVLLPVAVEHLSDWLRENASEKADRDAGVSAPGSTVR